MDHAEPVVDDNYDVESPPSPEEDIVLASDPKDHQNNPFQRDIDGGMHAGVVEGPGTYYFGIIDVLEHWTWRKQMERWIKIYFR